MNGFVFGRIFWERWTIRRIVSIVCWLLQEGWCRTFAATSKLCFCSSEEVLWKRLVAYNLNWKQGGLKPLQKWSYVMLQNIAIESKIVSETRVSRNSDITDIMSSSNASTWISSMRSGGGSSTQDSDEQRSFYRWFEMGIRQNALRQISWLCIPQWRRTVSFVRLLEQSDF